jgi:hypothetical protein
MDGQAVRWSQRLANPLKLYLQFLSFVTYIAGNRIIFVSMLHVALRGIKRFCGERRRLHYVELVIAGSDRTPMSSHLSYL